MTTGIWEERFGGREADSDGSRRHRHLYVLSQAIGKSWNLRVRGSLLFSGASVVGRSHGPFDPRRQRTWAGTRSRERGSNAASPSARSLATRIAPATLSGGSFTATVARSPLSALVEARARDVDPAGDWHPAKWSGYRGHHRDGPGRLDGDRVYDRAVGPMQFIPSTWAIYRTDGNRDGRSKPQLLGQLSRQHADARSGLRQRRARHRRPEREYRTAPNRAADAATG